MYKALHQMEGSSNTLFCNEINIGQHSADIAFKRVREGGIRRPCQVMRPQLFHHSKQEGSYSYSTPL